MVGLQFVKHQQLDSLNNCSSFEKICNSFQKSIVNQSSEQVFKEFVLLTHGNKDFFEQKMGFPLENITEPSFHRALSFCSQILLSHWYQTQADISLTVSLFRHLETFNTLSSRRLTEQEQWTQNFVKRPTYRKLKKIFPLILEASGQKVVNTPERQLENLRSRYPFLYKYSFLDLDFHEDYEKMINLLKTQKRRHFAMELTKYVTYRVRLVQVAKARQLTHGAGRFLHPIVNPTLLNDQQLKTVFSNCTRTFQSVAPSLFHGCTSTDILNYLLSDINERSTESEQAQFKTSFHLELKGILDELSKSTFNKMSLLEGGRRILNFLFFDNSSSSPSSYLSQLMLSLNSLEMTNFLIKLIKLSPDLKWVVEYKLFQLFESSQYLPQTEVKWLLGLLETYLLAISLLNKELDLSTLNLLVKS